MIKTNWLRLKFLSFFLFFLFSAGTVKAENSKLFNFGLYLFEHKEYFRAVSEFERFIFFEPHSKKTAEARFYIGRSYYNAELYYKAIETFETLEKDKQFQVPSLWLMGDAAFHIQQYDRAYAVYQKLYKKVKTEKMQKELLFRSSWPLLKQHKFHDVLAVYDELDEGIVPDLPYLRQTVGKLENFKGLSPFLAGTMSALFPGLGQMYDKRAGDGIVAFLTVGILASGSYFLWKDYPYKEVALAVSATGLFFYLGNIYSAFSSAAKYNKLYYKKNISMLENNYWTEYEQQ